MIKVNILLFKHFILVFFFLKKKKTKLEGTLVFHLELRVQIVNIGI